mmetsp:Transcript_86646/g.279828  ORF Transcript_86646/g.279828 Transcript_86646/m.279828 type:complete len:206 (+) Transcript_86646:635-1252(+)
MSGDSIKSNTAMGVPPCTGAAPATCDQSSAGVAAGPNCGEWDGVRPQPHLGAVQGLPPTGINRGLIVGEALAVARISGVRLDEDDCAEAAAAAPAASVAAQAGSGAAPLASASATNTFGGMNSGAEEFHHVAPPAAASVTDALLTSCSAFVDLASLWLLPAVKATSGVGSSLVFHCAGCCAPLPTWLPITVESKYIGARPGKGSK